jgi:hypothetical protein
MALAPADPTVLRLQSALAVRVNALFKQARDTSDRTFQSAAEAALGQRHAAEARNFLLLGLSVNPQSPELTRAQAELASPPTPEVARTPAPMAAPAPIPADATGKLKQQLAQQASAGDVDGAARTANLLRNASGGAGVPGSDLQQQLIESYAQSAKKQMMDGSTTTALQTLAAARREFAGAPNLKNLEVTYDRVEEEVERINMAPSLSVKDHQAWIAEIHQLAGEDFAGIELMLADTLANDIADQSAKADRPSVVASLLDSGRRLFPEYTSILEHGTAGVLDPAQILVAEEPQADASGTAATTAAKSSATVNVSASTEGHALQSATAQ